jgi:hypothetical protein
MRYAGGSTDGERRRSGRKLATTLAAPRGDDGTAGAGAHTQPEPVRLRPPAIVRLKGALAHGRTPSLEIVGPAPTPRAGWRAVPGTGEETLRPAADASPHTSFRGYGSASRRVKPPPVVRPRPAARRRGGCFPAKCACPQRFQRVSRSVPADTPPPIVGPAQTLLGSPTVPVADFGRCRQSTGTAAVFAEQACRVRGAATHAQPVQNSVGIANRTDHVLARTATNDRLRE